MRTKLKILETETFAKAIEDLKCGKTRLVEISSQDFEIEAFELTAPEGYKAPDGFPFCCQSHQHIFDSVKNWFSKFPNCCQFHKNLLTASWFEKTNYEYAPQKVSDQLSYTSYIIDQRFDNADWYDDITDYIDYNYTSFGQLPKGYGSAPGLTHYLDNLKHNLETSSNQKLIGAPEKTRRLIQFVSNYFNERKGQEKVDFNQLETIYNNWLKIFPFNIQYFRELKSIFENRFPIFKGPPTQNRYSQTSRVKVRTQEELIELLNTTTISLLASVTSGELIKKNLIANSQEHAIELINESHRIKQDSLLIDFRNGEEKYVKVLKKWIKNEKDYFKELTPFLKMEVKQTPKVQYPPVNEEVFEDLVCDLFNALYPNSHYLRFGKRGNNQKGIDILSVYRKEAVQCKKKDLSRRPSTIKNELRKDFETDIKSAMTLEIDMELLIFASSFENNAGLEEQLQRIRKRCGAKFNVQYLGWNSLSGLLHQFSDLVSKYYG